MFEYSLGTVKCQVVFKNANVLNVFTNEWIEQDIAVQYGTIVGVGHYEGENEIDLKGKYVVPGFIDAHMHIESTLCRPEELSKALLQNGTTSVICDPHELVNVRGKEALDYILAASKNTSLDIYTMLPSSVPCSDIDTNGAGKFSAADMESYLNDPYVIGLGEVMRVDDVVNERPEMVEKLELFKDMVMDGHAPQVSGKVLQAYRFADIATDHESSTYEEAIEKLRAGFYVLIREGSQAKNMEPIVKGFLKHHIPFDRTAFCTDDCHIDDILCHGHINAIIRKAIELGVNEKEAYKMASWQPAQIYGLKRKGAIAAGYQADFVVLNNPKTVEIDSVYKNGYKAALKHVAPVVCDEDLMHTVMIPEIVKGDIQIKRRDKNDVIEIEAGTLLTKHLKEEVPGYVYFEPNEKYSKVVVIERHGRNGNVATGILKGYGIENGSLGSTIAHDSHNMIIAGDNDDDILLAAKELEKMQGGYVLIKDHQVFHRVACPIAGLMSTQSAARLAPLVMELQLGAHEMGIPENIDPFQTLSFLSLPVIGQIRILDTGVYDVDKGEFVEQ